MMALTKFTLPGTEQGYKRGFKEKIEKDLSGTSYEAIKQAFVFRRLDIFCSSLLTNKRLQSAGNLYKSRRNETGLQVNYDIPVASIIYDYNQSRPPNETIERNTFLNEVQFYDYNGEETIWFKLGTDLGTYSLDILIANSMRAGMKGIRFKCSKWFWPNRYPFTTGDIDYNLGESISCRPLWHQNTDSVSYTHLTLPTTPYV